MKKKYSLTKSIGKKNMILALVALVLVMMTVVGASFSWIEEVSQVEFNSNNGQETPLHVGSKVLKADVNMKENPTTDTIDLNEYFYKSGDMHLSPCYGDGESFYFPVTSSSSTSDKFRVGTKDDANVNYLSATFRVKSEAANTGYWFEKSGTTDFITFKNSSGSAITGADLTNLKSLLRVSVTVDGNTNVYAYNTNGTYKTLSSSTATSATSKTGRRVQKYMYYAEAFNNSSPVNYYKNSVNDGTNKPNQGATDGNLNGNTLFTVNKYDSSKKTGVKEVTVKLWLEYHSTYCVQDVKVSNINLNIVSSWNKTRRIYVQDKTIHQAERTQEKWLTHNGNSDNQAGLYWALKEDTTKHWEMTRVSSTPYYYVDIPAVYNNVAATLYRKQYKDNFDSTTWDSWDTVFPNTFHSETYTVYTSDFGTWDDSDVHYVYFVNSTFFTDVYDYMWDSHSVINNTDINAKVVMNAKWPGIKMKTKTDKKTNSQSLDVYAFYYNSDYDRIIFNNGDVEEGKNHEYQTQDLWLTDSNGDPLNLVTGTFDMATLTWFHTNPAQSNWSTIMPNYSASNSYLYGNFSTDNVWKKTRFAYGGEFSSTSGDAFNGTNANNMLAKVYIKAGGDYEFIVYHNGTCYKTYPDNVNLYPGNTITMYKEGGNNTKNVYAKNLQGGHIYRFYISNINNESCKISLAEGEAHNN